MTDNLFAMAGARPSEAHTSHRSAALDLLTHCPMSHKEGGFLGHVAVADDLSDRQTYWLVKLLARNGRPPLVQGAGR